MPGPIVRLIVHGTEWEGEGGLVPVQTTLGRPTQWASLHHG